MTTRDLANAPRNVQEKFLYQKLQGLGEKGRELFLLKTKKLLLEKRSTGATSKTGRGNEGGVKTESNFSKDEVRSYLRSQLPKHMLPSILVALDQFPKLPNGKVDRVALQRKEALVKMTIQTSARKY